MVMYDASNTVGADPTVSSNSDIEKCIWWCMALCLSTPRHEDMPVVNKAAANTSAELILTLYFE